jgi:hypothetical protein
MPEDASRQPANAFLRRWPRSAVVLLLLAAVGYLWFIRICCAPYAGSSDASGYLNTARLLRQGALITDVPRIEGLSPPAWDYFYQQPLGFIVDRERGTQTPTYPLGYSLHLFLAAPFVGLDYATIPVNVLLAFAAAALMLALGRQFGLPWPWALACVAVLWGSPIFILFAVQPMSDVAAMVWVLAALCGALRARERWPWAFGAGVAVAIAVLVRPSNLLVIVPLAFVLGLRIRAWLALGAGGLPGALFLAWYNATLYGSPFRTGYGSVSSLFRASYVPLNAFHVFAWLMLVFSPVVVLAALALPVVWKRMRFFAVLAGLWCAAFGGFYLFYYYTGEVWWYLRFLLPIAPALIVAGALVLFHLRERWRPRLRWLPAALLAVTLLWEITASQRLHVRWTKQSEMGYQLAADWTKAHLPSDAILLQMQLSGAFTYYTDFTIVRWDLLDRDTSWPVLQRAARDAGRPLYAVLYDFEIERAWPEHIPGRWAKVADVRRMSIWKFESAQGAPPVSPPKS